MSRRRQQPWTSTTWSTRPRASRRTTRDKLKETAADLTDIATGEGSATDKLKAATEAVKEDLT